ncbi:MAG: 2-oxo acid dehydrogenase subunit E2 [Betaproteobacteria bacterium]|nr:MAG: 2-oxo acid dehydrogenase subunit E2 [Betaproteobacteria bacterium]
MAVQFRLAALGHTMEKGRVLEWFVAEGGTIKEGEPLLSVETDKAAVDVDAPISGVLLRIVGQVDEEYEVGATLAWIGEEGEEVPDTPELTAVATAAAKTISAEKRVTPVARRLAERHGIDADAIDGTGPDGRVTKEDVQRAIDAGPAATGAAAPGGNRFPLTGIQHTAAERLSASWRETPLVTEGIEVDFSACLAARAEKAAAWQEAHDIEPSINDIVLKATAETLKSHMRLNAAYADGAIEQFQEINLGVAVDSEQGLIVPVVHGADRLNIGEIAKATRELGSKAREGKLGLADLEGGTFTVTNLGGFGVDWFTPVLNPPQCAILGVGRVRRVPVVVDDEITVRDIATLVLSFDHRVVDGAPCARFLADLKALIENPSTWLQ